MLYKSIKLLNYTAEISTLLYVFNFFKKVKTSDVVKMWYDDRMFYVFSICGIYFSHLYLDSHYILEYFDKNFI
jgi:hypothetical protein